jgi:putative ABC transport system ATP-binding protein
VNDQHSDLRLHHLTRQVTKQGDVVTIVDDLSYHFESGQIYSLMGPSGAGKTSLLRLINRLDEPTSGRVELSGRNTAKLSPCELRQRIGFLFQVPFLFTGSVADNIRFARPQLSKGELLTLAARVNLDRDMLERSAGDLSVGEQQRVALARLMATEPKVVLLDEPTAALDPSRTESIERLIRSLAQERSLTVIMVSHHPQQAVRMGGQALLMVAGKLIEDGPAEKVVTDPLTDLGRRYRDKELT